MTRQEEQALLDRVRAGDREAFEPLVRENQARVYHIALRITGNETDACDAAQEAFIRAYSALPGFRGESRFSTWLYRLAGNAAIDLVRGRRGNRTVSLYETDDEGEAREWELPDERFEPEAQLEKKELREALSRALAELPTEQRAILSLRELGGLSYGELAQALALEEGTVKSRLSRARQRLCAILVRDGNISAPTSSKGRKGGAGS